MAEVEKLILRKLPTRFDDLAVSPGRLLQRHETGLPGSVSGSLKDDMKQPAFKKLRLDMSLMTGELSLLDSDGTSLSSRNHSMTARDQSMASLNDRNMKSGMETASPALDSVNGECSTCGDVGFQTELFLCSKGCSRLQHTYCSNSYNPRKRWFIGLCNWCEAEASVSVRQASVGTATKSQMPGSRREGLWSSTSRVERTHAVECLLGAALRLPGAGFSGVEDLFQGEPLAGSCGMRRKPLSFDSVEKAKRSGPSCDNVVKASKRLTKLEISNVATDVAVKSTSSSIDTCEKPFNCTPPIEEVASPVPKPRRSPTSSSTTPQAASSPPARDLRSVKRELPELVEHANPQSKLTARRTTSCDSDERRRSRPNSPCNVVADEKATRSSSGSGMEVRSPKFVAAIPRSSTIDDKSSDSSSLDSAVRLKRRSRTFDTLDKSIVESQNSKSRMSGSSRKSPQLCNSQEGSSDTTAQPLKTPVDKSEKAKRSSSLEKVSLRATSIPSSDEHSNSGTPRSRQLDSGENSGGGGSDCSNITQEQKSLIGKDLPSSPRKKVLTKQTSAAGRQTVRPNYVIGKSIRASATEEKLHRKIFAQKDSSNKLRRTSSKMSGFHNYKSLSDILC